MLELLNKCCEPFLSMLKALPKAQTQTLREIRIRAGQPICLIAEEESFLSQRGTPYTPTVKDIEALVMAFCERSPYAHEEQIASGYLSLPGGHRAGLCGHGVVRDGRILRLAQIQGLNIRIARQFPPDPSLCRALFPNKRPVSALVISPPGLGKTTLLRGFSKHLSDQGNQVALVDERGELAAMQGGVPQLDVGTRTDVMDACPKALAIPLLIRAMAPDVIITDELGSADDLIALQEAARCGIPVIASAHGKSPQDIRQRPVLKDIDKHFLFERYIVLGQRPGQVTGIYDREGRPCRYAS